MTSLRRSALLWMTALLAVVGALAFAIAYEMARREAADFLDGQLRQVALNAGGELVRVVVLTAQERELRLLALPSPHAAALPSEPAAQAGPLGRGEHRDGAGEQGDPDPAHDVSVAPASATSSLRRRSALRGFGWSSS